MKDFRAWMFSALLFFPFAPITQANMAGAGSHGFGDCVSCPSEEIARQLGEVSGRMNAAHRGLSRQDTSEATRREQAKAVALLDELIRRLERPPRPRGHGDLPREPVVEAGGVQGVLGVLTPHWVDVRPWVLFQQQRQIEKLLEAAPQLPDRYREILSEYSKQLSETTR